MPTYPLSQFVLVALYDKMLFGVRPPSKSQTAVYHLQLPPRASTSNRQMSRSTGFACRISGRPFGGDKTKGDRLCGSLGPIRVTSVELAATLMGYESGAESAMVGVLGMWRGVNVCGVNVCRTGIELP